MNALILIQACVKNLENIVLSNKESEILARKAIYTIGEHRFRYVKAWEELLKIMNVNTGQSANFVVFDEEKRLNILNSTKYDESYGLLSPLLEWSEDGKEYFNEEFDEQYRIMYDDAWADHLAEAMSGEGKGSDESLKHIYNLVVKEVDKEAKLGDNYHGAEQYKGKFTVVEPDSSIKPEGAEVVSKVFVGVKKSLVWLDDVFTMIEENDGLETNKSTGLHVNIGTFKALHIAADDGKTINQTKPVIDVLKLAVLSGDHYLLEQFGRFGNTFAKSLASNIRDLVNTGVGSDFKTAVREDLQKSLVKLNRSFVYGQAAGDDSRYRTINMQHLVDKGYLEFRIAGGINYHADRNKAHKAIYRYVQLCAVACDPDAYFKEYMIELYKRFVDSSGPLPSPALATKEPRPKNVQEAMYYLRQWSSSQYTAGKEGLDRSALKILKDFVATNGNPNQATVLDTIAGLNAEHYKNVTNNLLYAYRVLMLYTVRDKPNPKQYLATLFKEQEKGIKDYGAPKLYRNKPQWLRYFYTGSFSSGTPKELTASFSVRKCIQKTLTAEFEVIAARNPVAPLPKPHNPSNINPALLTFDDYSKSVNKQNKFHDSDSYKATLKSFNFDYKGKREASSLPSTYKRLIQRKVLKGITFEFKAKIEPTQYGVRKENPSGGDFEWEKDESGNTRMMTTEQIKAKGLREHEYTLAVFNPEGLCVGKTQDEWGAMLVWVAEEYRGFGIGPLLIKYARALEPDKDSGGFTIAGINNLRKHHRELVRDALTQGLYRQWIKAGTLTKEQAKAIIKSAGLENKPSPNKENLDSSNPKDWMLYSDFEYGSFIIYDKKLKDLYNTGEQNSFFTENMLKGAITVYELDDPHPHCGIVNLFGADNPKIAGFLFKLGASFCKHRNIPFYVDPDDMKYISDKDYNIGEESFKTGPKRVEVSIKQPIDSVERLGIPEKLWRSKFDKYGELLNGILEVAHSKFRYNGDLTARDFTMKLEATSDKKANAELKTFITELKTKNKDLFKKPLAVAVLEDNFYTATSGGATVKEARAFALKMLEGFNKVPPGRLDTSEDIEPFLKKQLAKYKKVSQGKSKEYLKRRDENLTRDLELDASDQEYTNKSKSVKVLYYANRSTPQVVKPGQTIKAKAGYGKRTKIRSATPDEIAQFKKGKWLRTREDGKSASDAKSKVSKYRPQLANKQKDARKRKLAASEGIHYKDFIKEVFGKADKK